MKMSIRSTLVCLVLLLGIQAFAVSARADASRPVPARGNPMVCGVARAVLLAQGGFFNPDLFATPTVLKAPPVRPFFAMSKPFAIAYGTTAFVIFLLLLGALWRLRGEITLGHVLFSLVSAATIFPVLLLMFEYMNHCDTSRQSYLHFGAWTKQNARDYPRVAVGAWFVQPPLLLLKYVVLGFSRLLSLRLLRAPARAGSEGQAQHRRRMEITRIVPANFDPLLEPPTAVQSAISMGAVTKPWLAAEGGISSMIPARKGNGGGIAPAQAGTFRTFGPGSTATGCLCHQVQDGGPSSPCALKTIA